MNEHLPKDNAGYKPLAPKDPTIPKQRQKIGDCAWCGEPAYTNIYTGKPGNKGTKLAPVCAEHEQHFTDQGAVSEESTIISDVAKQKAGRWHG